MKRTKKQRKAQSKRVKEWWVNRKKANSLEKAIQVSEPGDTIVIASREWDYCPKCGTELK